MFVSQHHREVSAAGPAYPTPDGEWDFVLTAADVTPAVIGGVDFPWTVNGLPLIVSSAGTQVQDGRCYAELPADASGNLIGVNFQTDAWTFITAYTAGDLNSYFGARGRELSRFSVIRLAIIIASGAGANDIRFQTGSASNFTEFGFASLPGWDGDIEGIMFAAGQGDMPTEARGLISSAQGTLTLDENNITANIAKVYTPGDNVFLRIGNRNDGDGFPFTIKRAGFWKGILTFTEAQAFIDAWKT